MIPSHLFLADPVFLEPVAAVTGGGLGLRRTAEPVAIAESVDALVTALDERRGLLLSGGVEAPGRYRRQALGFVDPPLSVNARGRTVRIDALNPRGRLLLPAVAGALDGHEALVGLEVTAGRVTALVRRPVGVFAEEERSRQPSVFSVLRALMALFACPEEPFLGLYGAFGYDLAFQFEAIRRRLERPDDQRDLVLYLPDRLLVVDHAAGVARRFSYEFVVDGVSTEGVAGGGRVHAYRPDTNAAAECDHAPGEYQQVVRAAKEAFNRGDLFEVVPGQTFAEPCADSPATIFRRLRTANPAPYEALINLGDGEFLVAASPEMYVRVGGRRVETCPISGTVARGGNALGDASQILTLLNSAKDAAELTMCTDVDRNDKARVCEPGSVRVIGRRMIELYSRLIHTVDHVEGRLRDGFDALDAFLTHTWAVTVTGAPKRWAMQFLEDTERSPRRWYGGAFGRIGFDGGMDTGLTLRTIRMKDGIAFVRAGATLLSDSDPDAEDAECRLKASAFLDAVRGEGAGPRLSVVQAGTRRSGEGRRVLLVDHDDSFVHTLADYFRQTGASVTTLRHSHARVALRSDPPDLLVLSPGPGRPADFDVGGSVQAALDLGVPVFGVCLGLQGMAEHFGAELERLPEPMHGKASPLRHQGGGLPIGLFEGLPQGMRAGRYHSLVARRDSLPPDLRVTAETEDGTVMAIEHRTLPLAAVQFHPESILTLDGAADGGATGGAGLALIANVMERLAGRVSAVPEREAAA